MTVKTTKTTKTTKTAAAPKAEKAPKAATKKTAAPVAAITIAEWIKTVARARGVVGDYVKALRDDKTIKLSSSNKSLTARLEADENGKLLLARYAIFAKRGSSASARSSANARSSASARSRAKAA